ncbi:MAG: c-type cytochrome domain-containing protein, partial [Planctomycetota bacterium]|nr:c-type cytochrome domain-containing protein [Planctomycetota bacterium]
MSLLILAQNSWGQTSDSLPSSLKTHCAKCHGGGDDLEGELNLLAFKTRGDFLAAPSILQRVIEVLEDREMPPVDEPQIPESDRLETLLTLKTWFTESAQQLPFNSIPMRRMNRFQYNNAVVDLLELDRDIFQLNERLLRRRSDYFNP